MNDVNIRLTAPKHVIGEQTTFRWDGIEKPIYWATLSIKQGPGPSVLDFAATLKNTGSRADTVDQMAAFAAQQAQAAPLVGHQPQNIVSSGLFDRRGVLQHPLARLIGTPFDLKVPQCWLLIELDSAVNWSFSDEVLPCHAKHPDPPHPSGKVGANVNLRLVYPDGVVLSDPTARPGQPYRFIFLGVVHRTGRNSVPGALGQHHLNFEVKFHDDGGVLPATLDPDVGNDGPDEFPSPP